MLITQCHLTLCHPMDAWSPAGFSVHGILQARTLKWVASCFSRGLSPVQFSSVLSLSRVRLFATLWTAAHQASLSIINSQSLLKLMSIELVMPSNLLILCHPLSPQPSSFPASGSFPMSQFFTSGGPCIGVLASASVLPMNIQD